MSHPGFHLITVQRAGRPLPDGGSGPRREGQLASLPWCVRWWSGDTEQRSPLNQSAEKPTAREADGALVHTPRQGRGKSSR